MTQEMQAKGDVTMAMGPPPAYKETDKTKLYTIAMTVIIVTVLVVSFGVFYMAFTVQSPTVVSNVTADDAQPIVIIREVDFEMFDGVPRNEKIMAEGNVLTIENVRDGYRAIFDFDTKVAVFKNLTSNTCYFTRLEDIPMQMGNLSAVLPVFFRESASASDRLLNHSNARMFGNSLERIPAGYLKLTDTDQCLGGSSFWIEPMDSQTTRNVRQTAALAPITRVALEPIEPCETWIIVTSCETVFITVC